MDKKDLVIFAPIAEFHNFCCFNVFLSKIKDLYNKITVVAPSVAIDIISYADEFISATREQISKYELDYPKILEKMDGRSMPVFFEQARKYIDKTYDKKTTDILYYNWWAIEDMFGNRYFEDIFDPQRVVPEGKNIPNDQPLGKAEYRSFFEVGKWFENNNAVYPTEKNYLAIKEKYGHLFDENTILLQTRNFKNKQPHTNTLQLFPYVYDFIKYITDRDIRVINFGFPPQPLNIDSSNYIEMNESLTQGDVYSLFYLAKLLTMTSENGGYISYWCGNTDLCVLSNEIGIRARGLSTINSRKQNKLFATIDLIKEMDERDFETAYQTIKNHKKVFDNSVFAPERKIHWLNY